MKKKILFICFIFCFAWQTNGQTEFAPIGAEWYYTYTFGCCPENHFNHIVSEEDTIIEGSNCRILRKYYDNSTIASEKYIIKQEQGKVYYYYQDQFNLLLDFDAEVGDTIKLTFMYKRYYDDNYPSGKDTIFSARYKVEDITINAQNLKSFKIKVLDEDVLDFYGIPVPPYEYQTYSYIEKIGIHSEFMPVFDNVPHPSIEVYLWLRCYHDVDFSFISDEWAVMLLPCNHTISANIKTLKDENVKVYPNPFNDNIFVFTDNGGSIEIIDILGKIVYSSRLLNGINKISTTHLCKGIFLAKIQSKNQDLQIFKIIKL